jgi:hypothetical protein
MSATAGMALIAGGVVAGLWTASSLWGTGPARVSVGMAAASGAAVGAGALLVQDRGAIGDWIVAVGGLAMLTPVHLRVLLGRTDDGHEGARVVAERVPAAYKGMDLMSRTPNEPGLITEPAPMGGRRSTTVAEPVAPPAAPPRGSVRRRARQTRVVLRKVGPWSVFKFSLLFYFCVMLVILLALGMLYAILGAVGAIDSVTRLARDLFADPSFQINGGWVFTRLSVIGLAMVVVWSLINVFVVFLYNLISDVVGGIEVTLTERR